MRARLLVDSELALWALAAPARLGREVRELLDAAEVYVSAASILELGLKSAPGPLAAELLAALEPSGFETLAVSAEHAAQAAGLAGVWADPVDRLLVAQASAEGMTLLTTDAALAAMPSMPRRAGARPRSPRRVQAAPPPDRCPIVLVLDAASGRRRDRRPARRARRHGA